MTEEQYYFYAQGRNDAYFKGVRYDNLMNGDNRQAYIKGYETGLEDLAIDKELENENA